MDGYGEHPSGRITVLADYPENPAGRYVLYWMQQSQREPGNAALEYAVHLANRRSLPVLVVFCLVPDYPDAQPNHWAFMMGGLRETAAAMRARGIGFRFAEGDPVRVIAQFAAFSRCIVCDWGYLRHQRQWRYAIAEGVRQPVEAVEADVVVPVMAVSSKVEWAAATLRPKIRRLLPRFLAEPQRLPVAVPVLPNEPTFGLPPNALPGSPHAPDHYGSPQTPSAACGTVAPGYTAAVARLEAFLSRGLDHYWSFGSDPVADAQSRLSPYLHFGQIGVGEIVNRTIESVAANEDWLPKWSVGGPASGIEAFLEQLIVRRELACNLTTFQTDYDQYAGLPEWAKTTLANHREDERSHCYSLQQLENAETHDRYWNAAQREMVETGSMHGYMRMYWGKKIIEWTANPAEAFDSALFINNRYELDGRDPNGYAGIAWCFGRHDRAWAERPVFGKVRFMNDRGLERKFAIEAYARRWGG